MTDETRYDQLRPEARALVDDYDALDLADMLVTAKNQLAALRAVARGYCPACGRGDAAPTIDDWEQQKQRADEAERQRDGINRMYLTAMANLGIAANRLDQIRDACDRLERAVTSADGRLLSGHDRGVDTAIRRVRSALNGPQAQETAAPPEPCAGRPCAGTGCSHERAADELIAHDQAIGLYPPAPVPAATEATDTTKEQP